VAGIIHIICFPFLGLMAVMDKGKSVVHTRAFVRINAGKIIKYFCLSVLVYCLLMTAWPMVGGVYSKLYCKVGKFLFGSFSQNTSISFSRINDHSNDIHIIASKPYYVNQNQRVNKVRFRYSIHYGDYMPSAFFAALVIAAPLPLKRKGRVFIFGLILLHVIAVFKISVIVLCLYNERQPLLVSGLFWDSTTGLVFALFIWILIVFRREDWGRLLSGQGRSQKQTDLLN
jgi:hypothetical protein